MSKLKPLIVPQNTLDLKNFTEFCKIHKNYVDTAEYYQKQLKQRKNETDDYGLKILFEHFLKTDKEWKNVLNEKDYKIIDIMINKYVNINEDNWIFRCLKTGNFYQIHKWALVNYSDFKGNKINIDKAFFKDKFEIKDNKIILSFSWPGMHMPATCYRNGYDTFHYEKYHIDLLDYSINLIEKSNKTPVYWRSKF